MLNDYESFALDHFLTEYPKNWDFERIVDAIENRSEAVGVWEPFENFAPFDVVNLIDMMVSQLWHTFPSLAEVPS